jgi:hypothetical protein
MHHWLREMMAILVVFGLLGPAQARARPPECVLTPAVREVVRDHNTKAKQEFEEDQFLPAALQWLTAQDSVPSTDVCAGQRSTRVDLALRSLRSYLDALHYDPDDPAKLGEAIRLLKRYDDTLPVGEQKTILSEQVTQLDCVRGALPDNAAALACTPLGLAALPPPTVEPVVQAPAPAPAPAPVLVQAPAPLERPRPGLAIGFGVSLGLSLGALAAAVGTWATARTGGTLHRQIRDAAAASLTDSDPANDVPPNLSPDQDYCVVADGVGNRAVADLCTRHNRRAAASITSYVLSGTFAVMAVTFGAIWVKSRRRADKLARRWHFDLASRRGGAILTGTLRF